MNRYRVLLPLRVHTEDGSYGQGEEFDKEFSAADEEENLRSGLLEIVPREYRVVSDSRVYDTEQGDTFTRALTIGQEEHLILAGHIERVEQPDPPPAKKRTTRSKKEAT